jgi:hypothetical protein
MHIPTQYYKYEVGVTIIAGDLRKDISTQINVPDWIVEEHDYYSDEHRVYAEHDENGNGIGLWDFDDSYNEDDDPFDIWLNEFIVERFGKDAKVVSYSLVD